MTNHEHERALELIMRRGTEEVAAPDAAWLKNIQLTPVGDDMQFHCETVKFTRLEPA